MRQKQGRNATGKSNYQENSCRTRTSPLRNVPDSCTSHPLDNAPLSRETGTRLTISKSLDTKKQKSGHQRDARPSDESRSVDKVVQIGAISVESPFKDSTRTDSGVDDDDIESPSEKEVATPESLGSAEHVIEAHVVEDSFVGDSEEEREKYEQQARQRFLAEIAEQAAQAEVVSNEDEKRGGPFLLRGALCVILALIVTVTTSVILSRKASSEPALYESAVAPSVAPFSDQPSLMPTSEPLNNTFCEQAHPLVVGQAVSGNFKDAIQATVINCEAQTSFASSAFTSPSRWYLYRGEGFPVIVRADESVVIHVHLPCRSSDSLCECRDSECPAGIYYPENENAVLWESKQGTDYLILVSKNRMDQETHRNFTLTIETNDSLNTAFGPLTPGFSTIVGGSTVGTKVASNVPACGSASVPTGPGVWYSVLGNGKTITASTCGSPTGLDTQISVFSNETVCVDGNDDFCGSGKSQVAWLSNSDEMYFVHVHGKDAAEGTFILQVTTEGASIAEADYCANAKPLEVGFIEMVDFSEATIDADLNFCTERSGDFIGNFYTFVGTGKSVQVHVSNATLEDLPFYIVQGGAVLAGSSCSALECITPDCAYGCQVPTILGQTYYVYVYYEAEPIEEKERFYLNGLVDLEVVEADANT